VYTLIVPIGFHNYDMKSSSKYLDALGPVFERFFILGGPRGTRQKKLQKVDSMNQRINPSDKVNFIEAFLWEPGGKLRRS
jgi:hypothetical protein